mmetsp:Transcript_4893/g.14064  ORF Transcript_4893/g.14064 Transcript_4893/m.14064 type:complete len:294 (+) Transcript_4893:1988-2869(+)
MGLRRRAGSRRPGAGAGLSSFSACSAVPFAGAGRGHCSFAVCTALVVPLSPWVAAVPPSEAAFLPTAFLPAGFGFGVCLALLPRFVGAAAAFSARELSPVAVRRVARSSAASRVPSPWRGEPPASVRCTEAASASGCGARVLAAASVPHAGAGSPSDAAPCGDSAPCGWPEPMAASTAASAPAPVAASGLFGLAPAALPSESWRRLACAGLACCTESSAGAADGCAAGSGPSLCTAGATVEASEGLPCVVCVAGNRAAAAPAPSSAAWTADELISGDPSEGASPLADAGEAFT